MSTSRDSKASPRQHQHHRRRSEPIQQPFLNPYPHPHQNPSSGVSASPVRSPYGNEHAGHSAQQGSHLAAPGAYLRPSNSRHHSSHSVGSNMTGSSRRPHPQQKEFVPSANAGAAFVGGLGNEGLGDEVYNERYLFDEAVNGSRSPSVSPDRSASHGGEPAAPAYTAASPARDDWDNLRDGSIARRPRWRRPSPAWIYPFIVGATLALGMGMAPKSELFINLACLAHPPQAPATAHDGSLSASGWAFAQQHPHHQLLQRVGTGIWEGDKDNELSINSTIPSSTTLPADTPLSAADKWFLKMQHDIYEYKLHHHQLEGPDKPSPLPPTSSATTIPTRPMPTGPLPRPSEPPSRGGDGDDTPDGPSRDKRPDSPSPRPSEGNSPYHEIDPRLCKRDPSVQATAARLSMVISLTAGILSALTTGFWGQTSDRKGRTKVLALCQSGLMLNDVCFILVASFPYLAPGGYRALLIGPALDGLLGGFSTISATINAYMSDVTPDGSRAAAFARLGGIAMTGFACGPILGSFLIKATGNIMAPFYVSVCVHALFVLLFSFLLPESLSTEARQILAKNAKLAREAAKRQDALDRAWENETPAAEEVTDPLLGVSSSGARPRMYGSTGASGPAHGMESGWSRMSFTTPPGASKRRKQLTGRAYRLGRSLLKPFEPLAIFLPMEGEDGKKIWGLTYIGLGQFCLSMLMGVMSVKTQFAFYTYGWTSAQLGPYMSLMGFSRGIVLIVLMPIALHFLRPLFRDTHEVVVAEPGASAISATSGTSSQDNSSSSPAAESPSATEDNKPKKRRTAKLDLLVIRWSLFLEAFLYLAIAFNPSQELFVILTVALTLGSGSGPATSSLALSFLPTSNQAGRLFGGMSVLSALGSTMLSPLLFGTLFSYTVGWYAPTVFALASGILFLAWTWFMCVRIPGSDKASRAERGRSRRVKRMNSSSVHVR